MKNKWKETVLGEFIKLNYGKSLTSVNRKSGKVPVYGSSGITGYHSISLVNEESLIIGRKGTVGSIFKSKVPFFPIDTVYFIKKSETKCDWDFLFYLLKFIKLGRLNFDAVVPGLNREVAYAEPIYVPSDIEEQKAIAGVLSSLDDKIELLREQNKTLEATAQTIFKEWFVHFNFPDENGKPYKNAGGKMIDSELGEIPPGWRFGCLGEVIKLIMGQSPSSESYNLEKEGLPLLNGAIELKKGGINPIKFTTDSKRESQKGDILLCIRATIGNINISDKVYSLGRGVASIRPNRGYYLYVFYLLENLVERIAKNATGSVIKGLSRDDFNNETIIIPEESVLKNFDILASPIFKKIKNNSKQIQKLSKTRDTLLPKLMSGEVEVNF